jgi:hypothetical protein
MKNLLLLVVVMVATLFEVKAQQGVLVVKRGSKGLYLDHKVAPKEGLYSIGRLYNANAKFIAEYNGMDLNKGLNIDQLIQIPLTDTNFSQKTSKGVPVYYISEANENLVKVSNAVNKVLLKDLRTWNKLTNDNVAAGSKLIVGFLVSGQASALAANTNTQPKQTPVKQEEKPIAKTVKIEEKPVQKAEPDETKPVAKTTTPESKPVVKNTASDEKTIAKNQPAEAKQVSRPVSEEQKSLVKNNPVEEKTIVKTEPPNEKEFVPEIKDEPKKTEPVFAKDVTIKNPVEQGYFKRSFEQQVKAIPTSKEATVNAGIFKTTSGWQDGKYYLLIDGVATGTIVKLINPSNNKAVYAKVLGQMNGIRQNQGLDIRISNAAAATLGVSDTEKFVVKVNY